MSLVSNAELREKLDAKQDAGHRSGNKMHQTYNRKLRIVEPAE